MIVSAPSSNAGYLLNSNTFDAPVVKLNRSIRRVNSSKGDPENAPHHNRPQPKQIRREEGRCGLLIAVPSGNLALDDHLWNR